MPHYIVVSPLMRDRIEDYHCLVFVDAPNKTKAKGIAVGMDDMWPWVCEAKGDNCNPFRGLEVTESICGHGVCWCPACEKANGPCPQCEETMERLHQKALKEHENC